MKTFISLIFLMACSSVYAANITASIDVNPVLVNDTFHLTYTASGSVDDDPDFSPINNDFELLGTRQSTNMSMINGTISRSKKWTLTLLSKKVGTFIIPAISFGSDRAPEVKVEIKNIVTSNSATPNQNFMLEMTASQKSGYTQQQFVITVKLLIAQNINDYQFSDLTTSDPDTIIMPLGKDQQYKTYRGSKQYIVVEKKYAIFPQKAERLKINPFIAAITINSQSSSRFYDPFNTRTTSKRLYSKGINLNIKAIPAQYTATNWLPSASLKIKEEWPKNNKFISGEPITRTIIITAADLTSAQLPDINQVSINGIKQYPDKPELQEKVVTTGLLSSRKQKIALIPTHAGSYTLPAIDIQWWNTTTDNIETAHLAARTFTVLPAPNNGAAPITTFQQPLDSSVKANAVPSPSPEISQQENKSSLWFWISTLFIFLWLATLILWWRSTVKQKPKIEKKRATTDSLKTCLTKLKSACEQNNAEETKKALLAWAKVVFTESQPNNLSDIAIRVDQPLQQSINKLNAYLYRSGASDWRCTNIYDHCKNFKPSNTSEKEKSNAAALEPLKPSK